MACSDWETYFSEQKPETALRMRLLCSVQAPRPPHALRLHLRAYFDATTSTCTALDLTKQMALPGGLDRLNWLTELIKHYLAAMYIINVNTVHTAHTSDLQAVDNLRICSTRAFPFAIAQEKANAITCMYTEMLVLGMAMLRTMIIKQNQRAGLASPMFWCGGLCLCLKRTRVIVYCCCRFGR